MQAVSAEGSNAYPQVRTSSKWFFVHLEIFKRTYFERSDCTGSPQSLIRLARSSIKPHEIHKQRFWARISTNQTKYNIRSTQGKRDWEKLKAEKPITNVCFAQNHQPRNEIVFFAKRTALNFGRPLRQVQHGHEWMKTDVKTAWHILVNQADVLKNS